MLHEVSGDRQMCNEEHQRQFTFSSSQASCGNEAQEQFWVSSCAGDGAQTCVDGHTPQGFVPFRVSLHRSCAEGTSSIWALIGNVSAEQVPHGVVLFRHRSKSGQKAQALETVASLQTASVVWKHVHDDAMEVQVLRPLHHLQTLGGADVQSRSGVTSSAAAASGKERVAHDCGVVFWLMQIFCSFHHEQFDADVGGLVQSGSLRERQAQLVSGFRHACTSSHHWHEPAAAAATPHSCFGVRPSSAE